MKKIIAYKGFDKDLKCRDFQYEIGKTYTHNGAVIPCASGFHACEIPMDVLEYYEFDNRNRFCEVELSGEIQKAGNKSCAAKIKVNAEIKLPDIISKTIDIIFKLTKLNEAASSGDDAKLASSGNNAKLESKGKNSVLAGIGINNVARGIIGNWLVLAEYDDNYKISCVKAAKIDGKTIKADTWYRLQNGEFTECD